MKRQLFLAAAASAICLAKPLLAKAENPTKRASIGKNVGASGFPKLAWECGCAVVWLDTATRVYYHKGEPPYGRTNRGAYTCEEEAIQLGNRANGLFRTSIV
jgi:hypothetical protein